MFNWIRVSSDAFPTYRLAMTNQLHVNLQIYRFAINEYKLPLIWQFHKLSKNNGSGNRVADELSKPMSWLRVHERSDWVEVTPGY